MAFGLVFFGLVFFGFVYRDSSRCFDLFLLNFTVPLLLANVLGYINTLFTMCAAGT